MSILPAFVVIISFSIIFNSVQGQPSDEKTITFEGSTWKDLLGSCVKEFICKPDHTTGWKDKDSLLIIKSDNHTHPVWSYIAGDIRSVMPAQMYEIKTHMKLNEWTKASHVVIEALNKTSNQWYQLTQCPKAIDGPVDWREFNCKVTIPMDTTMIRPVINAGWSSRVNEEAKTWFDSLSVMASDSASSLER